MRTFKTLYGKTIPDVVNYIKDYLTDKEDVEILIGSDSQCYNNSKTVYGVVIALYTKGKGAHVICSKDVTPMERDLSTRLINEVWKAVEVAELLKEGGLPKVSWIDIDLNPDPRYKSNRALRQAVGLVEGMGYKVRYKHNGAMITYGANHLVRI